MDGVHRSEWVFKQLSTLLPTMKPGGYILFDDINFSDDMERCWQAIAERFPRRAVIERRVGLIRTTATF